MDGLDGPVLGEVPAISLHEDAPLYDRPMEPPTNLATRKEDTPEGHLPEANDVSDDLLSLMQSQEWITSQYDSQLFLNTVAGPGSNAAVLRLKHPVSGKDTGRGLAVTTDGNHRWCAVDPKIGTAMTVAESMLNLACVGAEPRALVNCLNFGNPENPNVMWQLSEAVDGMAEACSKFNIPVVGGNVSLYNESQGNNIDPTPIVGLIGVITNLDTPPPGVSWNDGDRLMVIGPPPKGLSGSAWAFARGKRNGHLDQVDYQTHERLCQTIRMLVTQGLVTAIHDISNGGLAVAVAEMAVQSGVGCSLARVPDIESMFSESPSRVVIAVDPEQMQSVEEIIHNQDLPSTRIGLAHGDKFTIKGLIDIELSKIQEQWEESLPRVFESGTTQG